MLIETNAPQKLLYLLKKYPPILIQRCYQDIRILFQNPEKVRMIGQIALIKYTKGTPASTKLTIGASFKRKVEKKVKTKCEILTNTNFSLFFFNLSDQFGTVLH